MPEILLAQDLGKTLTAAPVSIKYLHLLRLSATYNNLEGNNLGSVASAKSCHVSVFSPGARVATLLWLNSLKRTRKGLGMCVLYHRKSGDNSRRVLAVSVGGVVFFCDAFGGGKFGRLTSLWLFKEHCVFSINGCACMLGTY